MGMDSARPWSSTCAHAACISPLPPRWMHPPSRCCWQQALNWAEWPWIRSHLSTMSRPICTRSLWTWSLPWLLLDHCSSPPWQYVIPRSLTRDLSFASWKLSRRPSSRNIIQPGETPSSGSAVTFSAYLLTGTMTEMPLNWLNKCNVYFRIRQNLPPVINLATASPRRTIYSVA